jgi:hypothetical protein
VGDDVAAYRNRRHVGALVSTIGLFVIVGAVMAPTGANPTSPHPVILTQVPPPADTSDAGAGIDTAAGNGAAGDPGPAGGLATAAEAPLATTSKAVASAKAATTRPRSVVATTATTGTVEQRGAAGLALINYPWERTGYSIVFTGPNTGLLGLTDPNRKQITIYIRPTQSTTDIARVLGHEIGHSVDFTMTTDAERADYRRIRGLDDRPWYPSCIGCSDYASPAGDWAETFAFWLLGDGSFASALAPKPTAAQLTALTPIFTPDALGVTTTTGPPAATTTTTKAPRATTPKATTTTAPRATTPRPRPTTTTTRSAPTTTTTRSTSTTTTTRSSSTTTTTRSSSTTTTTGSTPTTQTTANPGTGSTSPSPGSSRRRG